MNDGDNPMSKAHAAPRCTATSKRTGERCKGPAVKGWRVCRFHGAGGGHSSGKDHPSWRHGMRSQDWIEARAEINDLVREVREIERQLAGGQTLGNPQANLCDVPFREHDALSDRALVGIMDHLNRLAGRV